MNHTGVSIVLGTYNRKRFLIKTIESIRDNKILRPFEIIVIDGGSDDGTIEYLVKQKDIISIVQHNHGKWKGEQIERRSWGYFMNLGFKCAQGKYICMISDDSLLIESSIENAIKEIETLTNNGEKIGGAAFYFRDWPRENEYKVHLTYGNILAINHGIFISDVLEKVGYIDESYRFYCADGDLSLKIWHKGYKIIDCKSSIVEHHAHAPSRMSHSNKAQYQKDHMKSLKKWEKIIIETGAMGKWKKIKYLDERDTVKDFPYSSLKAVVKEKIRNIVRKYVKKK